MPSLETVIYHDLKPVIVQLEDLLEFEAKSGLPTNEAIKEFARINFERRNSVQGEPATEV